MLLSTTVENILETAIFYTPEIIIDNSQILISTSVPV